MEEAKLRVTNLRPMPDTDGQRTPRPSPNSRVGWTSDTSACWDAHTRRSSGSDHYRGSRLVGSDRNRRTLAEVRQRSVQSAQTNLSFEKVFPPARKPEGAEGC